MDDPLTIRSIVWGKLWSIVQDVHENSDKSGNLTTDQENKIEGLDIYLCSALEINRKDFPDPDGG